MIEWLSLGALCATLGCNSILGNAPPDGSGTGGMGPAGGSVGSGGVPAGSGGNGEDGAGGSLAGADGSGGDSGDGARTISCGLNDRGSQDQVLVDGEWEDDGDCNDPDECTDDTVELGASCADGKGTGTQSCTLGSWVSEDCVCTVTSEEYDALADACVIPIPCDAQGGPFGGGNGVATPYAICSATHLINVSTVPDARFVLAASLDLSDVETFAPIGFVFSGEFDGAGRALVGLTIDRSSAALGAAETYVGLFKWLEPPAVVRDLQLRDFDVYGGASVGTLAGRITGPDLTVDGVHVLGESSVTGEGENVGGLAGLVDNVAIGDCSATSDVTSPSPSVGGLIGSFMYASLDHCTASGTVTGTYDVGGVVGYSEYSWLTDCAATGVVTGDGGVGGLLGSSTQSPPAVGGGVLRGSASGPVTATSGAAGGLVGAISWGTVVESSASGDVSGVNAVGGLVGSLGDYARVSTSSSSGNVSGETNVGGLVGIDDSNDLAIEHCWASGDVTGTSYVGGLVGVRNVLDAGLAGIDESYAFGIVTWAGQGTPPANIGALAGFVEDSLIAISMARTHAPALPLVGTLDGSSSQGSFLLSAPAFGNQVNFSTWDFTSVWAMSADLDRPILQWQADD